MSRRRIAAVLLAGLVAGGALSGRSASSALRKAFADARETFYDALAAHAGDPGLDPRDAAALLDARVALPRAYDQLMGYYLFLYPRDVTADDGAGLRAAAASLASDLAGTLPRAQAAPPESPLQSLLRSAGVSSRRAMPPVRQFVRRIRNVVRKDWMWNELRVAEAHRTARGEGVRVAVLDTGVDMSLLELRTRTRVARDFLSGVPPFGESPFPCDWDGHGTSVATTVELTAPRAELLIGKIYDLETMSGTPPTVWTASIAAAAFRWAAANGADVISLSAAFYHDYRLLREAVADCWARNIVVVASQGHLAEGEDPAEAVPVYPASYPETITVGGVERAGGGLRAWSWSRPGPHVDVAAPAAGVLVEAPIFLTRSTRAYRRGSGNSLAAPAVSGTAALMLSAMDPGVRARLKEEPGRLVETIRALLRGAASRERLGPGADERLVGAGAIDVPRAVRAAKELRLD